MVAQTVRRCLTFLALAIALALPAAAQSQVYVLDEGTIPLSCSGHPCYGPTLHLINTVTSHDLASIQAAPRGQRGTSVKASSDGRLLFVTSVPYSAPTQPGLLLVVDTVTKATIASIPVGAGPTDVAVLPDGSRAYVVNGSADTISVVDLATFAVVTTVAVQSAPRNIVAAVNGGAVYVTNSGSGTVTKISTTTDVVSATITVGGGPEAIDISPDGSRLFVANVTGFSVSVIDAGLDSLLRSLPIGNPNNPPIGVAAPSATEVYVLLRTPASLIAGFTFPGAITLLDAATGAALGSVTERDRARTLTRDSSGSPAYAIVPSFASVQRLAPDATSVTTVSSGLPNLVDGDVITDPCAFEATATATVFRVSGGSGTLTIPAPAGCSWTIETSRYPGLSVDAPLTGTGPATRAFRVAPASVVRLGFLDIGRQAVQFEQTIPRMNVEFSPVSATMQEPFSVGGWAMDENAFSNGTAFGDTGIDAIHVWAYPASGAPIFVGAASLNLDRADVAALYGPKYESSGFSIAVGNLPSGGYTLVFYAHSSRSHTFSNVQAVNVTVRRAPAQVVIDAPAAGTVKTPFTIAGWAVDPVLITRGPGVDVVHIWAYPASGAPPVFLGQATYGKTRFDVAAYLGSETISSGYELTASLPPGSYTLAVFARSIETAAFTSQTVNITVVSKPLMVIDTPGSAPVSAPAGGTDPGTRLNSPFTVVGWALDLGASTRTGVDTVHLWAYPVSGAPPVFVGEASRTTRTDVGAVFGAQFNGAGFALTIATLPAGSYDLVVFAHSTVTRTFNNVTVVRITVP
jgi:YVTN family beta-propeller protein